ncbi:hypothetical protein ACFQWF_06060 [Methylorubrum suomiense]
MPIFVFDNGGIPPDALSQLGTTPGVVRLGEGRNLGIGAALNRLAEAAAAAGFRRLFLLDQDADTSPDTARALGFALDRLAGAMKGQALVPALIGPAAAPNPGHKAPRYPLRPRTPPSVPCCRWSFWRPPARCSTLRPST